MAELVDELSELWQSRAWSTRCTPDNLSQTQVDRMIMLGEVVQYRAAGQSGSVEFIGRNR